jgi:hypothetical protein
MRSSFGCGSAALRFCFSIGMCSNRTLPWLKNV